MGERQAMERMVMDLQVTIDELSERLMHVIEENETLEDESAMLLEYIDNLNIKTELFQRGRGILRRKKTTDQTGTSPTAVTPKKKNPRILDVALNPTVFTVGIGSHGQLGQANTSGQAVPAVVEALRQKNVSRLAAGDEHSGAVSEDGRLFVWGSGTKGQLGFEKGSNTCATPTELEIVVSSTATDEIAVVGEKTAVGIKSLSCGPSMTAVVTDSGDVWSWGSSDDGCLGHQSSTSVSIPTVVDGMKGKRIVQVSCGGHHTLSLSEEGLVYSWGQVDIIGRDKSLKPNDTPALVDSLVGKGIASIACGGSHSLAMSADGIVYAWGRANEGQIGIKQSKISGKYVHLPTSIPELEQRGTHIATGENSSAALTSSGKLYTWGSGNSGQLGHGDTQNHFRPAQVQALKDHIVIDVDCGRAHTVALLSNGQMFVCGDIGVDSGNNFRRLLPTPSCPIRLVKSGRDHIVALSGHAPKVPGTELVQPKEKTKIVEKRMSTGDVLKMPMLNLGRVPPPSCAKPSEPLYKVNDGDGEESSSESDETESAAHPEAEEDSKAQTDAGDPVSETTEEESRAEDVDAGPVADVGALVDEHENRKSTGQSIGDGAENEVANSQQEGDKECGQIEQPSSPPAQDNAGTTASDKATPASEEKIKPTDNDGDSSDWDDSSSEGHQEHKPRNAPVGDDDWDSPSEEQQLQQLRRSDTNGDDVDVRVEEENRSEDGQAHQGEKPSDDAVGGNANSQKPLQESSAIPAAIPSTTPSKTLAGTPPPAKALPTPAGTYGSPPPSKTLPTPSTQAAPSAELAVTDVPGRSPIAPTAANGEAAPTNANDEGSSSDWDSEGD